MDVSKPKTSAILVTGTLIVAFLGSCKSKNDSFITNIKLAIQEKDESDYSSALNHVTAALNYDSSKSFACIERAN
jgi:hypothetical protein